MPPAASIVVPADVRQLAAVRRFVRDTLADAHAPVEAIENLVQAVDEIVTNVIEHGYAGRSGPVEVEVEVGVGVERGLGEGGGEVTVHVRDACPPFDPTGVPPPDTEAPLARRSLGGMGIHLSRVLTDAMTHRILPSGGNELTLVKRLRSEQGGLPNGDPG